MTTLIRGVGTALSHFFGWQETPPEEDLQTNASIPQRSLVRTVLVSSSVPQRMCETVMHTSVISGTVILTVTVLSAASAPITLIGMLAGLALLYLAKESYQASDALELSRRVALYYYSEGNELPRVCSIDECARQALSALIIADESFFFLNVSLHNLFMQNQLLLETLLNESQGADVYWQALSALGDLQGDGLTLEAHVPSPASLGEG